jgi:protein phosphatase PTC7
VGGWVDSGIDPSLFSQTLMYHAHRYSRGAWAGEPEIDPALDYAEREVVEGWEMPPLECLDLAYGGVLRERFVEAGERRSVLCFTQQRLFMAPRVQHSVPDKSQCIFWSTAISKVSCTEA